MARARLLAAGLALVAGVVSGCSPAAPDRAAAPEVSGSTSPVANTAPTATPRPNVLLVMTDDMRYDDLQWMPNTQRFFARRGTDFRNMFAPTPLCCPNRASFLTGKYSHNHHVWWHLEPWGYGAFNDSSTIGGALQRAGYRTGYIGKYLNRYGVAKPKAAPKHRPATYVPPGWDEWRATPDDTDLPSSDPRDGSTYDYFDTTVNVNGRLEGHPGEYNSTILVDQALTVMDRFESGKRPWYVQLNSLAPHHGLPFESDDPLNEDLATPARPGWVKGRFNAKIPRGFGIPATGQPEADVSDKAVVTRTKPALTAQDRLDVRTLSRQRAETLFALDRELGRVFRHLRRTGQLETTTVVFTSDNGYMQGEHRWKSGKVIGFEPSYRVPLLIAGPGVPKAASEVQPVNTVDLTATVLDWAHATMPGTDGTSFARTLGRDRGWDTALGYESFLPSVPNLRGKGFEKGRASAVGIRTAGWFYVRYSNREEELFDLRKDPLELDSVAKDPATADVRRAMDRLWWRFRGCDGTECRIPLPAALRTDAATTRRITAHADAEIRRYYGRDTVAAP